ncbi:tRNA 2-selenouridine(34) synthase MnmH [Leptolyngbya sp. AN02str]|uniref:tRNA 2-selenouridine(34) synthase MnmH n=1 Tax=Leptolyngbya sp. AN02str TaxID=3423363 RepID=UPI003D323915
MAEALSVAEFLAEPGVVLDVRSPGEYEQGHIPGAVSFPLFTDEERAQVGICYKHEGRDAAVELGFALVGPKLAGFIARAKALAPDRTLRIHCWRGGMRSGSVAWALRMAGFHVTTLEGGYKAFRRWVLETFACPRPIVIVGGMTGCGKTEVLHALIAKGEQVLDLEAIAHHRGSSFGALGQTPQPTNEQFENEAAVQWASFSTKHPVWIEAESKRIGLCRVPEALFQQMERSPVLEIVRSREERIALLLNDYGDFAEADLIAATERIRKRLGGLRTQEAIAHISNKNLAAAMDIVLDYYDKTYTYDLQRRSVQQFPIDMIGLAPAASAERLMAEASHLLSPSAREVNQL